MAKINTKDISQNAIRTTRAHGLKAWGELDGEKQPTRDLTSSLMSRESVMISPTEPKAIGIVSYKSLNCT